MTSRNEYLLLPASRAYIAFTILLAVVLNIMPWGRDFGIPDFLALVLVFWNVHQPRKVGIGIGFLLGLLMDVHSSSALGERALLYSLLSYGAWFMHRRVPWFRIVGQMLHVLPLFVIAQCIVVVVRLALRASVCVWWCTDVAVAGLVYLSCAGLALTELPAAFWLVPLSSCLRRSST